MSEQEQFADLLRRTRKGDEQAATELVRLYEPLIRREVRVRLSDPSLYRVLDSMDICQSVLGSFFVRAAVGEFEVEGPAQLLRLLIRMARNKVASAARKQQAQKREGHRLEATPVEELDPAGAQATPSRIASGKELLQKVRQGLSEEECRLADLRGQGRPWDSIAAEMGGTPDGRRMQLARALDRVTEQLGLDEERL